MIGFADLLDPTFWRAYYRNVLVPIGWWITDLLEPRP